MSESLDAQLKAAIAHRRLVQLRYGGKLRIAEPHDYGVQNGSLRLLVYQLRASGGAPSKDMRGWRLLDVPKIADCTVLDETFAGSRGASHHQHHAWDEVYARVA